MRVSLLVTCLVDQVWPAVGISPGRCKPRDYVHHRAVANVRHPLTVTIGVHGPRAVHVILLEDSA